MTNKPEINREDIGEIIRVACEMKHADEEKLSVAELEAVAAELGIDAATIARARTALEDRARARDAARTTSQRQRKRVAAAAASVALVFIVLVIVARSSAISAHEEVNARRAQLTSVLERQREVEARYKSAPASTERDAELAGATNRVFIERRRYDEAATSWNQSAASPLRAIAISLSGLPQRAPLSNEVAP